MAENVLLNVDVLACLLDDLINVIEHSSVSVWIVQGKIYLIIFVLKVKVESKSVVIFKEGRISLDLSCYVAFLVDEIFASEKPPLFLLFVGFGGKRNWPNPIQKHHLLFYKVHDVYFHAF